MTQQPTGQETQQWNPDQASEQMAELFRQADEIFQQPHYQEVSTKDLAGPGADSLPPTEQTER